MRKQKTRIITLVQGGSGWGISFWKSVLQCGMQAMLNQEIRLGERKGPSSSDTDDTMIGTLYHAFQKIYHDGGVEKRGFDTALIQFKQQAAMPWNKPATVRAKADELFRAYRVKHPPDYFGEVLDTERRYTMPMAKRPWWAPKSMPLTAQIDMELKTTKASALRLTADYHMLIEPGNYLQDWKTTNTEWPNMAWQYILELQFPFYMMLKQHLRPKTKILGLIVTAAFKKTKKHNMYLIPFPSRQTQEVVAEVLGRAWIAYQQWQDQIIHNPLHCFAYGKPCLWAKTSVCKRSNFDG